MTLLSMIRGFAFALLVLLGGYVHAQQSCSQRLLRAEDLYNEGRLLEVEKEISGCLAEGGFTEAEEIRARKLLTKVAIFMDNEPKAEEELINLLLLDPVHQLQPEDPSEMRVLLSKFRTAPVFRLEFKGGLNLSMVGKPAQYSVYPGTSGDKDYAASLGIGYQVEANITRHIARGIEVGTGVQYRATKYTVESIFVDETAGGADVFTTNIANSQSMLRLPIFGRYNFNYTYKGERKLTPYVFAGVYVDYLLSAKYTEASRSGGVAVTITGPDADLKNFGQVNDLNLSLFGGFGLKVAGKKGNYFFGEVKFDKSLGLYNVPEERYANSKIHSDLLFVEDDIYLNIVSVNVGYIKSIFKPEKLSK